MTSRQILPVSLMVTCLRTKTPCSQVTEDVHCYQVFPFLVTIFVPGPELCPSLPVPLLNVHCDCAAYICRFEKNKKDLRLIYEISRLAKYDQVSRE